MIGIALALAISFAIQPEAARSDSPVLAISGHGGLTAGLNESGALEVLRWPGPGGPDQIRQPGSGAKSSASIGGRWSVEVGGRWYWFGDPAARTRQAYVSAGSSAIETTIEWPGVGFTVRQRAGVLRGHDTFVSAIEVTGTTSQPRVAWIADFAPATRQIPEIPLGDEALDALNGFAAFADRGAGRVWSFRPQKPGQAEWGRARELAARDAPPEAWTKFADGAWIAVTAGAPVANLAVAFSTRELVGAIESGATVLSAAVGASSVGIEATPIAAGSGYRAWIAVSVGASRESSGKTLDDAVTDAAAFFDAAPESIAPPPSIVSLGADDLSIATRHWTTLNALHDSGHGLTVHGLSAQPPLARDWPREGALASWALFEMGDQDAAVKSIEAYFSEIRVVDRARKPLGSMPASLYTNGEPASPHFVVDDRGPARVLWVADRIIRDRSAEERAAWVRKHWKAIEAAGEFLSTWMDSRRGAPLWAADPIGLSDAETQERVFAAYGGISAALRLVRYADQSAPETWVARQAQLQAMTEWILTEPGKWRSKDALLLEAGGISADALGRAGEICSRRLENPIGLDRTQLARLLLQNAIIGREAQDVDFSLPESVFRRGLQRLDGEVGIAVPMADSLVSSQTLIALLLRSTR